MVSLNFTEMTTTSSLFSAYASLCTTIMLFRTMFDNIVPRHHQNHLISIILLYFKKPKTSLFSLQIEEQLGMSINQLFQASETYLCSKLGPDSKSLKITKNPKENHFNLKFAQNVETIEIFEGVEFKWRFIHEESLTRGGAEDRHTGRVFLQPETRCFELTFEKKHYDMVQKSYLPFIIKKAEAINEEKKVLKLYHLERSPYSGPALWEGVNFEHPSTFDTLAMDWNLKKAITDDLDLFLERKEFYKKVGKAWKRGYLLYGPPGTGKSSLIAAMANYLNFDIYDLQLSNVMGDSSLRKLMLGTANQSILVMEDIDCSVELPDRNLQPPKAEKKRPSDSQFSLSGLLNFIDGLWSSCGEGRIIIFTTNNKDKLDPALLRPGRMDMHIHMSYLTSNGFKVLASNYLGIHDHHWRFGEIKELIDNMKVTPAEVAEELIKSNDTEISLAGLANFLKRKKMEADEIKDEAIVKDGDEVNDEGTINDGDEGISNSDLGDEFF